MRDVLQSIEWAALEWLTPLAVWWHLQLGSVPHLVLALAVFAVVCGILAAIVAISASLGFVPSAPRFDFHERAAECGSAPSRSRADAPHGGNGPRAPAVSRAESPAAA